MSVFLTGVYDPDSKLWCTVTKVGGFDDDTLEKLQTEMDMVKISKNINKVPDWLDIKKTVVPDFIVSDPKQSPVWEVAGAEFSKAEVILELTLYSIYSHFNTLKKKAVGKHC